MKWWTSEKTLSSVLTTVVLVDDVLGDDRVVEIAAIDVSNDIVEWSKNRSLMV